MKLGTGRGRGREGGRGGKTYSRGKNKMTSSRVGSSGDLGFTFFFFGFLEKNAERKNLSFMYLSLCVLRFRIESEFMAVFFILLFCRRVGGVGGERKKKYIIGRGGVVYISAKDFQSSGSVLIVQKTKNKKTKTKKGIKEEIENKGERQGSIYISLWR